MVVGASGFVGRNIVAAGRSAGLDVTGLRAPRVLGTSGPAGNAAEQWRDDHSDAFERLCSAMTACEVVVNAAGAATPGVGASRALFEANAVLPVVAARAAAAAGVRRFVHLSTASVQGRLDPLDETTRTFPLSPYASSKTEGESALLAGVRGGVMPPEVVLYRPTAIQASDRSTTRNLCRLVSSLPVVPVSGRGDRPAPVSLIENVAAGVLFAAIMPEAVPVVLQPWEGLTTRRLLEILGARRVVPLPQRMVDLVLAGAGRPAAPSAALTARLRRVELVLRGQGARAEALVEAGFVVPFGHECWAKLAEEVRSAEPLPADPGGHPPLPAVDPAG